MEGDWFGGGSIYLCYDRYVIGYRGGVCCVDAFDRDVRENLIDFSVASVGG